MIRKGEEGLTGRARSRTPHSRAIPRVVWAGGGCGATGGAAAQVGLVVVFLSSRHRQIDTARPRGCVSLSSHTSRLFTRFDAAPPCSVMPAIIPTGQSNRPRRLVS